MAALRRTERAAGGVILRVVAALAGLAAPGSAKAEDGGRGPLVSFVYENDSVSPNDRDYTAGGKFLFMTGPDQDHGWGRWAARRLLFAEETTDLRVSYGLGLEIYTPVDIEAEVPDPDDRPFAGFSYLSGAVFANTDDRDFRELELIAGVIGPFSQADSIQRLAHDITDSRDPNGWEAQISNRPGVLLRGRRVHVAPVFGSRDGFSLELMPNYGTAAGNVLVEANAGVMARFGWRSPVDVLPMRAQRASIGSGYFRPTAPFGVYIFGGASARWVGRDLFLDEESALGESVTREPFVGDFQFGLAAYYRRARLGYTHVWRTRQFEEQTIDVNQYGSLSLTVAF